VFDGGTILLHSFLKEIKDEGFIICDLRVVVFEESETSLHDSLGEVFVDLLISPE